MRIFKLKRPIRTDGDWEFVCGSFCASENDILPRLPRSCSSFFRNEHCDIMNSFFASCVDRSIEDDDYLADGVCFVFTRMMKDSLDRYGIEVLAIGEPTENSELFYSEMGKAMLDERNRELYWCLYVRGVAWVFFYLCMEE